MATAPAALTVWPSCVMFAEPLIPAAGTVPVAASVLLACVMAAAPAMATTPAALTVCAACVRLALPVIPLEMSAAEKLSQLGVLP